MNKTLVDEIRKESCSCSIFDNKIDYDYNRAKEAKEPTKSLTTGSLSVCFEEFYAKYFEHNPRVEKYGGRYNNLKDEKYGFQSSPGSGFNLISQSNENSDSSFSSFEGPRNVGILDAIEQNVKEESEDEDYCPPKRKAAGGIQFLDLNVITQMQREKEKFRPIDE